MRINYTLKVCVCSLFVFYIIFYLYSITTFATEDDATTEYSFNSVVEISEYSIDEGYIEAGKEATIALTLHNANRVSTANSIMIVAKSNSGMIYPAYGYDNQFYVGSLKAGESTTIYIPITVNSNYNSNFADLTCDIIYETGGKMITNTATMILPSNSINSVTVKRVEVSAHAVKNGKSLLSINYSNKSTENINDAVLIIDGNVSSDSSVIELDTIAGGKSYTKDFNVVFIEAGEQSINISIKYTDASGEDVETTLGTYDVTVDEEQVSTLSGYEGNNILKWTGRIVAIAALICACVASYVYFKKR